MAQASSLRQAAQRTSLRCAFAVRLGVLLRSRDPDRCSFCAFVSWRSPRLDGEEARRRNDSQNGGASCRPRGCGFQNRPARDGRICRGRSAYPSPESGKPADRHTPVTVPRLTRLRLRAGPTFRRMTLPDVPVPGVVRIALAQLGVIVPERFQAEPFRRQLAVASLRPVRAGLLADRGLAANVSHANTVRSLLRNKRLGRA